MKISQSGTFFQQTKKSLLDATCLALLHRQYSDEEADVLDSTQDAGVLDEMILYSLQNSQKECIGVAFLILFASIDIIKPDLTWVQGCVHVK